MKDKFNELIIGSGGLSGFSYLGSLKVLNQYYPLKNFTYFTGCSAGACLCTLINIGFKINELEKIILEIKIEEFIELKISNLLSNGGFVDNTKIKNLLISMFLTKNIDPKITFNELYNLTKKILTMNSVNQTLNKSEYFNYINTPNMIVIEALLMSMNIPLICPPIKYNNNIYFDGAVLDPYPHNYIKDTKKIGLIVFSEHLESIILKKNNFSNSNRFNHDGHLEIFINNIFLIYNNYLKYFYKKKIKNTIYIICEFQNKVDIKKDDKINLFKKGEKKANLFFRKKIKKLKKDYLLKKYFYLLKNIIKN